MYVIAPHRVLEQRLLASISNSTMSTIIQNTSPSVAKRIEKEITHEATKEERMVKTALKELARLEKEDKSAQKVILKPYPRFVMV